MNAAIIIRENQNSKYQVYEGDLLLACFGSKTEAEEYARIAATRSNGRSRT